MELSAGSATNELPGGNAWKKREEMFTAIICAIAIALAFGGYFSLEEVHPNWAHAISTLFTVYGLWLLWKLDRVAKKAGRR